MNKSFLFAAVCIAASTPLVRADLLDPSDFVSLGEFSSVPGSYTIDTNSLSFTGPEDFHVAGVDFDGIAVFAFDDFLLGPLADIEATGERPLALLSMGDLRLIEHAAIYVHASGHRGGDPEQRGQGPGGGWTRSRAGGGGGGFGGVGGEGNDTSEGGGWGGDAYGDLTTLLEGGSGGAGGGHNERWATAGGDGGGAVELAALNELWIGGRGVFAEGHTGIGGNQTAGGGGSGGGILAHAPRISLISTLSVRGGAGGDGAFDNGGGGGGGRLWIETEPDGLYNIGTLDVSGGSGRNDFFGSSQSGENGVLTITQIPEPASLGMGLTGVAAGLLLLGRRTRRPRRSRAT